jgi:hypothetical protein
LHASLSPFLFTLGGVRTPQFISGGWIDQQLPKSRNRQSNTYMFPNDIAPTLLEMAGGDRSYLLGDKTGAPYGNEMWEYIKKSVDPKSIKEYHQKPRLVSYTPEFFFDVQVNKTVKFFYNGDKPVPIPRLYVDPVWPKTGDHIMDTNYYSIKPCRPNGIPSDCCSWNIEEDWQERNPLEVDCSVLHLQAKELFAIEGGCPKDVLGRNLNPICLKQGEVARGASPKALSLWTHYGAAGPFTNSKGRPMNDLPMKCTCYGLDLPARSSNVDYFVVRNLGPSQCGKSRGLFRKIRPPQSILCDGSFAFGKPPDRTILRDYARTGFNLREYRRILNQEQRKLIGRSLPEVYEVLVDYSLRRGETEWPALGKFPFNGDMDTCKEKGVVPVPFPVLSLTPYMFGTRENTLPFRKTRLGLCAAYSLTLFFCPTYQNPLLKSVVQWNTENRADPYGVFADGTYWYPMGLIECSIRCQPKAEGSAYIGEGPLGLVV